MATRTTYTSTITVPVYASWKCEKCGEINFSTGVIVCKREETTSSVRRSKHKEAEANAANRAKAEWAENAFRIISDPNHNGSAMYNNFHLQNTNCTKCGKKPQWNKNPKFLPLVGLAITGGIISGLIAFAVMTNILAWIIFASCVGFIVWGIVREEVYKKSMTKLPKRYTPVIGSLNKELTEYANSLGKTIPTLDECIETVKNFDKKRKSTMPVKQTTAKQQLNNKKEKETQNIECSFCRKCGSQLQSDSDFCHKCGTKVIKLQN